jgi:hypothetical protein
VVCGVWPASATEHERFRRLGQGQLGASGSVITGDLDPVQLTINISALGFFYLMNRHTLSTVFARDLMSRRALDARLQVMTDPVPRWIGP